MLYYQLARDLWLEALDYDVRAAEHVDAGSVSVFTAAANAKRDSALRLLRTMGMPLAQGRAALEAAEAEERQERQRAERLCIKCGAAALSDCDPRTCERVSK